MSLEATSLGHLDLLRDVLEPFNKLLIEVVNLYLWSKWVRIVYICQPKSPVWVLIIDEPCRYRLANAIVLIFIKS